MRQEKITVRQWWDRVAQLGCIVTYRRIDVTLHHIKGGSVSDLGLHSGMSQRGINDWLVIPLTAELHISGPEAIDGGYGVRSWEAKYGAQVDHMDQVCLRTGINAWLLSGCSRNPWAS